MGVWVVLMELLTIVPPLNSRRTNEIIKSNWFLFHFHDITAGAGLATNADEKEKDIFMVAI